MLKSTEDYRCDWRYINRIELTTFQITNKLGVPPTCSVASSHADSIFLVFTD